MSSWEKPNQMSRHGGENGDRKRSGEKVVAMTPHFGLALRLAEAKAARAMKGRYSGVGNHLLVALKRSVFEFP
jgi:hypothetical protein